MKQYASISISARRLRAEFAYKRSVPKAEATEVGNALPPEGGSHVSISYVWAAMNSAAMSASSA